MDMAPPENKQSTVGFLPDTSEGNGEAKADRMTPQWDVLLVELPQS